MTENEDFYKRKEDQEWRDSITERVVNLTHGEQLQNDRLEDAERTIEQIDKLLEGDPEDKQDSGLKGDIKELNAGLNALQVLMAPDHLGNGGIINRLRIVEEMAGLKERRSEQRWKFITAVVVALVSLLGLIFTNLDRLEPFMKNLGANESEAPIKKDLKHKHHERRETAPD